MISSRNCKFTNKIFPIAGYVGAGSPDLDLAMAVEMSQLYTNREEASNRPCCKGEEDKKSIVEEKELNMAIELSLQEVQQKSRQSRFAAKSISTDGAEGELAKNVQEKVPHHFTYISEETNEAVR